MTMDNMESNSVNEMTTVKKPVKRFLLLACHVLWRELSQAAAESVNEIFPVFLRQGLHNEPDNLRRQLQAQIDEADRLADQEVEDLGQRQTYDAILIGYGLCSNGIAGLTSRNYELIVPRGHDCITFLLGDRRLYREYFDNNPGVYWYSGGWIATETMPGPDRVAILREIYTRRYEDPDTVDYLLDEEKHWMANYRQACFIRQDDLVLPDKLSDAWREYSEDCAKWCGWQFKEIKGDNRLLKMLVDGIWYEDEFLVVKPGQMLQPSHDQDIVKSD
jgi:hypothetical protein